MTKSEKITQEEIAMIKKAKAGDEQAFTWIFNKYQSLVDKILYSYIKDYDEARDLTNIVFLKVYEKILTFSKYDSLGGWVRTIASRVAIDYLRIKENHRYKLEGDNTVFVPDNDGYSEDDVVNHLLVSRIFEVLDRYRPHVRKIFELHYMKNMPVETVASHLRMPVGTVKSILSRVRNKIRKQIKFN